METWNIHEANRLVRYLSTYLRQDSPTHSCLAELGQLYPPHVPCTDISDAIDPDSRGYLRYLVPGVTIEQKLQQLQRQLHIEKSARPVGEGSESKGPRR